MYKSAIFLFLTLFIFSCKPQRDSLSLGKYVVGGFKVKSDMEKNGGKLIAATHTDDYVFDFISDDQLLLSSRFGSEYFADSVFQYKVTEKNLVLNGKHGNHVVPYKKDGAILNLFIDKNGIDSLQLIPVIAAK